MIECCLKNRMGLITLNRPEKLNALNIEMFKALKKHLQKWEKDPEVDVVVIRSAVEKAFSAGGDLRVIHDISQKYSQPEAYQRFDDFFAFEYSLNELIHNYKKPYVSLIHGIAMGGGLGISLHGKYRVVSEQVEIAMPECAIGFFPDVVSSAFLRECPGFIGQFLGVTGYRVNTRDALDTGIATHFMRKEVFDTFLYVLSESPTKGQEDDVVMMLLEHFGTGEVMTPPTLMPRQALIDEAFSGKTLGDAVAVLKLSKDPWAKKILRDLKQSSPLSLALTYDHLKEVKGKSFKALKQMDLKLASYCLQQGDFLEGIRAKIIDKDHQPKWKTLPS